MPSESRPPAPEACPDHLVMDGQRLPCFVKAAVYGSGQAAGLGIKTTNVARMAAILKEPGNAGRIREMLRRQVDEEMAGQGITYGVKEEEIQAAIEQFLERVAGGSDTMATRKIAEGQPPEPGEDAWLEYPFNPGGQALHRLGKADRLEASLKVNRVREGDVLVVRHPPKSGQKGCDVRGEGVEPRAPRDVSLETAVGTNTAIVEDHLAAGITGISREDDRGRVHVVQEVVVEEVNAGTGDLPRTGVATTNFAIHRGVRSGYGVATTEDVFVGGGREAGSLDRDTRVRARNLIVHGQVAGEPLPPEYLSGEIDALEEADRRRVLHHLERSQIEVSELFATREILGRNASAGTVLVQTHCYMSALDAEEDILVDGNLSGGVVSFGRRLQVLGNLGDAKGGATRIRIGVENRAEQRRDRTRTDIQSRKSRLEALSAQLETHKEGMERQAKKSPYWAALLRGEKRAPQGPVESRILVQFFQATKQKLRMEQAVEDCKREIADLGHLVEEMAEEQADEGSALSVAVGGCVYPGVTVEVVHPAEASEMEEKVVRRTGGRAREAHAVPLQEIKKDLAREVSDYLTPRQEKLEERKQAVDQIYRDREQRPKGPSIPSRRFEEELTFAAPEGEAPSPEGGAEARRLPMEGLLYVHSRDPQKFYLRRTWKVSEPLRGITISIERADQGWKVNCMPNRTGPTSWQRDAGILARLNAIQVLGQSAKALLLGDPTGQANQRE